MSVLQSNPADYSSADSADPEALECEIFAIPGDCAGLRLDAALAQMFPEHSRSRLQGWIKEGLIQLDGASADAKRKVWGGETICMEAPPLPGDSCHRAESIDFPRVYEDDALMVIDKPAGLVVHPGSGNWSGTLLNALLHYLPQLEAVPRAGIVHRLDKDTSGLMVVARTRAAMDALVRMIAAREVHRQYLALAHRTWSGPKLQRAEWPIGRDPRNRLRMAAVDLSHQAGKSARTDIELLENAAQGCWVRCILHTGRTHQIRVHMMMLGHPLVADELYGGVPAAGLTRQALHAYRLAFTHPVTGQAMEFWAPVPVDLEQALQAWGLGYNAAKPQH